jgi:hypothetical protein
VWAGYSGKIVGGVTSGAFIPMYDRIQGVMKTVSEVTQMLEGVANNMERFGNLLVWGDPTVTGRFVLWGILPIAVLLIIAWNTFLWLATHISINQVITMIVVSRLCFACLTQALMINITSKSIYLARTGMPG